MEGFDQITKWISENESLFSGLAAIVALVAIVPAALRPILKRRKEGAADASTPNRPIDRKRAENAKPRLAVFPVEAIGSNDDLVMSAEIVTVELTALLARTDGCEVISRSSASAFATAGGTVNEAQEALDVRYVVEGQVRSIGVGDGVRVSASLVDTDQGEVVWSEPFEIEEQNIAALSQTVAERIASHLGIEVIRAEASRVRYQRHTPAARGLFLQAQGVLFDEGHNHASYARAIELLRLAIEKEPDYAEAHGLLALLSALANVFGFVESQEVGREQALRACQRALEIDDRSSEVLGFVGCAYCDLQLFDQGIALLERSIELNPSNAQAKAALGTAFIGLGRLEDGAAAIEEALRLSPAYKGIAVWATVLVGAYIRLGRLDEARASIDHAMRCDPSFFPLHLSASLLAIRRGDKTTAERHAREACRLYPQLDRQTTERLAGKAGARVLIDWIEASS